MQNSFFQKKNTPIRTHKIPLPELLRPKSLNEFVGQEKLVGTNGVIRKLIEADKLSSMIFWGPPGVGKTTLARIIATETKAKFLQVSAVSSGKKDLQSVVKQAKEIAQVYDGRKTILFIDEIHRFNKAQQDYLLPFVENGTITLIGATTENPSFEVISALLSRCRVFTFDRHSGDELNEILNKAVDYFRNDRKLDISLEKEAKQFLLAMSNGDPRVLLNALEMSVNLVEAN